MKTYELTYIISPDMSLPEAESLSAGFESFIKENSGVIIKSDKPTAKSLSYRIKKQSSGFFVNLEIQLEEGNVLALKDKLEKEAKIIRNIILVKPIPKKFKERRERKKTENIFEDKTAKKEELSPDVQKAKEEKPETKKEKIDLGDIDKELDQILSE